MSKKLTVLGIGIIGCFLATNIMSQSLESDKVISSQNILIFLSLMMLSFFMYLIALKLVSRHAVELSAKKYAIWGIVIIGLLARLALFNSAPIQDTEAYRFIWDGQTLLQGENPYISTPFKRAAIGRKPFTKDEPRAVTTLNQITNSDRKSPYPPLAQHLFALGQQLTPWSLQGWSGIIFFTEVLIIFLLLKVLALAKIPRAWILLYAWSPLIIKEFSNGLHLDVFIVLGIVSIAYFLLKSWHGIAFIAAWATALIHPYSMLFVPIVYLHCRNEKPRRASFYAIIGGALALTSYLPYSSAGWGLFANIPAFLSSWRVNDGGFSVVYFLTSFEDFLTPSAADFITRMLCLFLVIKLIAYLLKKLDDTSEAIPFIQTMLIITLTSFLLSPIASPWRLTWTVPLIYFLPLRSFVMLTGLVFIYYLDLYNVASATVGLEWIKGAEYGIFFLLLISEVWGLMHRKKIAIQDLIGQDMSTLLPSA